MAASDIQLREEFVKFKRRVEAYMSGIPAMINALNGKIQFAMISTIAEFQSTSLSSNYQIVFLLEDANSDSRWYKRSSVAGVGTANVDYVVDGSGTVWQEA